jgi:pSer/pThr/pTyr-binding forkhead associated (FHA) protein
MTDPRLNSIHLEAPPRRQQFRRARELLLNARGSYTIAAEKGDFPSGPTAEIAEPSVGEPVAFQFVLMDKDYVFPLRVGINTIGRMPDNDVVLEDPGISRRHCAILVHAHDQCEIYDTASKNGTYLNGRRLTDPVPLSSGDEIRLCGRQLTFLCKGASGRSADAPTSHGSRVG